MIDTLPKRVEGRQHPGEKNQGLGCLCGCKFSAGRIGYLVEDADTEPLLEILGGAVYRFPADRHPTADFERREVTVFYRLTEAAELAVKS